MSFAAAGILMILVAVITLSFQTLKVANQNPVKSLRTEWRVLRSQEPVCQPTDLKLIVESNLRIKINMHV